MGKIKSAALFDLDHTLLNANSSFSFGQFLYSKGLLGLTNLIYLSSSYGLHVLGLLPSTKLHHLSFKALFAGMQTSQLHSLVQEWLSVKWEGIRYLPLIQELKIAQDKGSFVAILSNSPDFLVGPIAQRLHVKDWIATHYESDEMGCLSQIKTIVEGKDKADYLENLIAHKGIPRNCIAAYSDSILDLLFLEGAGRPVGVNPDRKLKVICQKNQWEMRV